MSDYTREWALKWIKGSVESYIIGRTSLEIIKGRIKKAVESYNLKPEEIKNIMDMILIDPLINVSKEKREEKLRPLIQLVRILEYRGEKNS
jgi:hypothetical protein